MKPPEAVLRQLVRQWLDKATADFEAAEQLSTQGGRFREIVAFHCQQAVEKYLKALLVRRQVTTSPLSGRSTYAVRWS
jgi:HEPN domain-containing protein